MTHKPWKGEETANGRGAGAGADLGADPGAAAAGWGPPPTAAPGLSGRRAEIPTHGPTEPTSLGVQTGGAQDRPQ